MNDRAIAVLVLTALMFAVGLSGCGSKPETRKEEKIQCRVVHPQKRKNIQDFVEYTGRTAAINSVDIKARVTGFLKNIYFKEGTPVTGGKELFLIDPEPYIAQYEQADAQVGIYDAQVKLTTSTYEDATKLAKENPKTFSALQLRTFKANMEVAKAQLKAAKESLKIYKINKDFTTVKSPIDGVVGRINQTLGNVIIQDQTLLTTVVSLERMYVYFDMDAPTFSRFQQPGPGQAAPAPKKKGAISLELPSEQTAVTGAKPTELAGDIDFFNNQFNPATDTILVRGNFPNPAKKNAPPLLRPGMFVRVKLSIGQPYEALLVPDRAIQSKMGKKYVYVADAANRVKEIPVVIGQLQEQGLRVIKSGPLTEKDRVIETRLLEIQPKQEIQPIP
jgi:multidrug efflux system membrane fusion protein